MTTRNISELACITFTGKLQEAFEHYGEEAQDLGNRLAFELEAASYDAYAAMSRIKGRPLMFGIDRKYQARMVTKRIKRAAELARGISSETGKFSRDYYVAFVVPSKARAKVLDRMKGQEVA